MSRYPAFHKNKTKEKIFSKAEAIWKSEGSAVLTLDRIMRMANLTVGGFYGHFKSKDKLLEETLIYSLRQASLRLFAGIDPSTAGNEWLDLVVNRYLKQAAHADLKTACPLPLLVPEMARSKAKLKNTFAKELSMILDEALSPCSSKELKEEYKRKLLTYISCCVGTVAMARALGDSDLSRELIHDVEFLLTKENK